LALIFLVILVYGGAYAKNLISISNGAKIFKKCQSCHQIGEGANRLSHQLNNIFRGIDFCI
jgi:cytochrome c